MFEGFRVCIAIKNSKKTPEITDCSFKFMLTIKKNLFIVKILSKSNLFPLSPNLHSSTTFKAIVPSYLSSPQVFMPVHNCPEFILSFSSVPF